MIALIWIFFAINASSVVYSSINNLGGSLTSLGLTLGLSHTSSPETSEKAPKIVIVGAGASGMSAAARLLENGYKNIVILEAESRIGGRVNSIPFGKGYIDLGAQWCEGEDGNVVYELVKNNFKFGDNDVQYNNSHCYSSDGILVDQDKYTKLLNLSHTITTDYDNMRMFDGSFGEFFQINYRKGLQDTEFNDIDVELADQIMDLTEREINILHASSSWFNISAKLVGQAPIYGNVQLTWKEHGYKTVFDYLTKKLPDPSKALPVEDKIKFNTEVTNIDWSSNEVIVGCLDGSEYRADHVVVTVSLGFLKKHHQTLFTPQLPEKKVTAIKSTGFGTLGKIFLEFEKPFWPTNVDNWAAYSFLWKQEDKNSLSGTDREYLTKIDRFIREDAQPNIIGALTAGEDIKKFEEINNKQLIDDCMWLLEKFLNRTLPRPINMRRSHWMTNKYFLGSCSYPTIDLQLLNVGNTLAETLYSPDNKPILLISGKATDEYHSGYVHGGVGSGWRAADEILEYYKSMNQ